MLGRHCIADISHCKIKKLDNVDFIKKILIESAKECNLHVVNDMFYKFNPIGVSGILVLSESHITIHTWPEYDFVAIDAFTCGKNMNPNEVCEKVATKFKGIITNIKKIDRGVLDDNSN